MGGLGNAGVGRNGRALPIGMLTATEWGAQLTRDAAPIPINPNQTYNVVQEVSLGPIVSSSTAGTEVDGAFYFYLAQLDQVTTLQAMFDQYRFLQVTVFFLPRLDMVGTTGTIFPTQIGHLTTALDYDDAASTAFTALRQRQTCFTSGAIREHARTMTPHAALAAYSGAFTSFVNISRMWVDSASSNVQHYGVKYALTDCQFVSVGVYDVYARYVVQFRQVI